MSRFDAEMASRLRQIRLDLFGEHGAPLLAAALGIPTRRWLDYEAGVPLPALVALAFLELTGAEAAWLGTGAGGRYRIRDAAEDR